MNRSRLSEIFVGFASKRLTPHQVDPKISHGHEFQGSQSLVALLGHGDLRDVPCAYFWLPRDGTEEMLRIDSVISWYDSRRNQPHRSAEWRLYYPAGAEDVVQGRASAGDLAVIAKGRDGFMYVFLAAAGSSWERKLQVLLNLPIGEGDMFEVTDVGETVEVGLAEEMLLEALGFVVPVPADSRAEEVASRLYERFDGRFPKTAVFSEHARKTFEGPAAIDDPDGALVGWMEWETRLFQIFEARILVERITRGFLGADGLPDVESFLKFARSVGNTRFSRAGWAFEHHVAKLLKDHGVIFAAQAITEEKKKPDFLFPSGDAYSDTAFPSDRLRMLAVKTSCKDRWRQVESEAHRIPRKHLLTLESPISVSQTAEMGSAGVVLVIPKGQHELFTVGQQESLLSVRSFLEEILSVQRTLIEAGGGISSRYERL